MTTKPELTALERQTAREMKAGAANSRRIAREEKIRERDERRAAKKAGMTLQAWRNKKFREVIDKIDRRSKKKGLPEHVQVLETDPYVHLPHQVRRAAAVADALANAHTDPNSAVLKLFRVSRLIDELKAIVEELF